MPVWEAFRLALAQLRVQKLKSAFTLAGVMVGVMFLIAVVSVVEGMGRYLEHDLIGKIMAVNSFEVRARPMIPQGEMDPQKWQEYWRRPNLMERDTIPLVQALPDGFRHAVTAMDNLTVSSPFARAQQVSVHSVTHQQFLIKNIDVTAGRVIAPQEDAANALVTVIGEDVKERFFPNVDPLGRELRIGNYPYRVIGVAESQGNIFGMSLDRFAIVPYGSPAKRSNANRQTGVIDAVIVQAPDATSVIAGQDIARQVMRALRKLRPSQPDNFAIESPDAALEFWNKLKSYLVLAGIILPLIGLVVGAIVIMNIMLVAVAERTREIGIRKSLGARRRDILLQFLIEAATLSLLGALLGVIAGALLAGLVSAATPLPTSVALWSVAVSVLLGAGVGIVAGVYPASRAARLDPITALRAE